MGMPFWGCGIPLKPSFGGDFRAKNGVCHLAEFGTPNLPSQKHPPPLPANLPLEQDTPKTPGLEHPQRYSRGGPVTLIIRVPGTPKRGGVGTPKMGVKTAFGVVPATLPAPPKGVWGGFLGSKTGFWGGGTKIPNFPSSGPPKQHFPAPPQFSINPTPERR